MIYPKGNLVKFEPTPGGRRRAAALAAEFPLATSVVGKSPHHVELLADFELRPAAKSPPAPPKQALTTGQRAALHALLTPE